MPKVVVDGKKTTFPYTKKGKEDAKKAGGKKADEKKSDKSLPPWLKKK